MLAATLPGVYATPSRPALLEWQLSSVRYASSWSARHLLLTTRGAHPGLAAEGDRLQRTARPVIFWAFLRFTQFRYSALRAGGWHLLLIGSDTVGASMPCHLRPTRPNRLSPYRRQGITQRGATPSSRPAAGIDVHFAARACPAARSLAVSRVPFLKHLAPQGPQHQTLCQTWVSLLKQEGTNGLGRA